MWTSSIRHFKDAIDLKIAIRNGGLPRDVKLHNHDVWELSIVIGGSMLHQVEDTIYTAVPGSVFNIIPAFSHAQLEVNDFHHYNFLFDLNQYMIAYPQLKKVPGFQEFFITEQYQQYRHKFVSHLTLSGTQLDFVSALCEQLWNVYRERQTGYKTMVDIYFVHLLTYLSSLYVPSSPRSSEQFHNIENTVAYIEQNYNTSIHISDLADIACLSERQYTRLFRQTYNITPIQYVIRCRLDHARSLISDTPFSIAQIAEQCGFFDRSAFTQLFKKHYKVTPGEYRRSCHEKKNAVSEKEDTVPEKEEN